MTAGARVLDTYVEMAVEKLGLRKPVGKPVDPMDDTIPFEESVGVAPRRRVSAN
jgi:hypothetical protein